MNVRITGLIAVVLGAVACTAAPTNGGHYQTYVASLCAHSSHLWNAQGNNQFTYELEGIQNVDPFVLDVTVSIAGEPPPGKVIVSEQPDLINLAVATDLLSPATNETTFTTCGNTVCNTGECVTVATNPKRVEWTNLAPTNGTYTASQKVNFDFSKYISSNPQAACDGVDYAQVPTTLDVALVVGDTPDASSFVVELSAEIPLKPACNRSPTDFNYVSGGIRNAQLLSTIVAKRQVARQEYELRLAEGVTATMQQAAARLGEMTIAEGYQIRDRATDPFQLDGLVGAGIEAAEKFAAFLGKDITPYTQSIENILSAIGVTDITAGQEALALAQSVINGGFRMEDLQALAPADQAALFDMLQQGIADAAADAGLAGEELEESLAWLGQLQSEVAAEPGVSTFDADADNPHQLPVSFDGDGAGCTMKCQVEPTSMEPYETCYEYTQRFRPGAAQGMTPGTHYRAAWYPGVGTVAQVCKEITIQRSNGEPLAEWKWQTYKLIPGNSNGYRCGDWAPSLGDVSHCPYSEANGLTCGVWSQEYCEP